MCINAGPTSSDSPLNQTAYYRAREAHYLTLAFAARREWEEHLAMAERYRLMAEVDGE